MKILLRNLFFLITLLALSFPVIGQPGCPSINAGVDQSMCNGSCANLSSTYLATGATTSYAVSSIAYAPPYSYNAGTALLVNIDDTWSGVLSIPFTFCFFGTAYTQLVAGSNGVLTFSTANAGNYCDWPLSLSCPDPTILSTSTGPYIMGPFHDIDPAVTGDMYYNTYGSYPCRTFVVSWNQVAMFSSSCNSLLATHMIILYETTNVIEVYVQNAPVCSSWNSGNKCIGIQDGAGTTGYCPPGRNTGAWSASNEAWRFTPNGASNYTVSWWQGATQIASGATTTVCPASTSTYNAQIVYTNCDATQVTVTDPMTVTINPSPTINISASVNPICTGTSTTLTASGGTTYSWSGGLGTSNPVTVTPLTTTTYTVTGTTAGCTGTASITINVSPSLAVGVSASSNPICAGTSTTLTASGGTTYTWSGGLGTSNPVTVTPASTTTYTVTGTTGGCTGTASITVNVNSSPTVSISASSNPICAGTSTTLTASGGTTYAWSGGLGTSNPVTVSPLSTTTYTVTGTTAGCTGTASITVNVNSNPTVNISASANPICAGTSTTLTASGGTTYVWSGGLGTSNPVTVTPASATTYTVTGTTAGCTGTADITININPSLNVSISASANPICSGTSTTLTASGGTTYTWSGGLGTSNPVTVTPATSTTYTVTGTSAGCTGTADITINIMPDLTVSISASANPICSGTSTTLTASGGTTYSWSGGLGTSNPVTVTPASTTTYTVTGTTAGCTGTASITVNVNPTPTANAGTDQIICNGQSANLTAFGGGTYLWSNSSTNQSTNVSPVMTTMYTVTVTSAAGGCTASDDVQVTVNPNPAISISASVNPICQGSCTTLTAMGGVSYIWSNPPGGSINPVVVCPASTTTYIVTGTDVNGCTGTNSIFVTVNSLPVVSAGSDQAICLGSSVNINAGGGTSYSWSPSAGLNFTNISNPVANPISTTTYIVTVTDVNGCSGTDDIIITVNPIPTSSFTLTSPVCIGEVSNITYTGSGSPAATYNWNFNGGTIISGAGQGPYQVSWSTPSTYNISLSVTENGCTSSVTTNAQIVGQLLTSIAITDSISCFGASDGIATVTANGAVPYQYNWSNSQLNSSAVNLSANTYTVTVTDNNGCTGSQSISLTEPAVLAMTFTYTDVTCSGGSNGSAYSTVTGGTTPYQYSWLPVGTAGNVGSVSTLQAGTYTLSVYDAHGCTIDTTFTISEPTLLTYTYITDSVKCNGGSDGSIDITTNGGNQPYAYSWIPSVSTGPTASNISAGPYDVTITDNNGCSTSAVITVYQPLPLALSTSGDVTICMGQNTTISAFATGGTGAYTFTWNGLGVGNSFNVAPLTTTTYSVSVTDGNGCTAPSQSLTVYVSPPINVSLSSFPSSICNGESSVLTATANGGNGIFTYNWSGIGVSTSTVTISPTSTTTYYVTVTDNCNSPQGVDSITIIVYPLPVVQFTSDTINGCEPLVINFSDQSSPAIAGWNWNFGDTQSGSNNVSTQQNPSHFYSTAGLYTVSLTVTTTNGCSGSATITNMIEVYPTPVAYFTYDPQTISIFDSNVNFIDMSNGASTWNWNFGDPAALGDDSSIEQSPSHYFSNPGTYYVTLVITSQYGCVDSTSNNVTVNPEFTFYAPSAFSPDGNGKNDYFAPKGEGWDLNNYELYIFDRWGEKIFETNDYNEFWNGKKIGGNEIIQQGVYTWLVIVKDFAGDTHTFKGIVTLLRK